MLFFFLPGAVRRWSGRAAARSGLAIEGGGLAHCFPYYNVRVRASFLWRVRNPGGSFVTWAFVCARSVSRLLCGPAKFPIQPWGRPWLVRSRLLGSSLLLCWAAAAAVVVVPRHRSPCWVYFFPLPTTASTRQVSSPYFRPAGPIHCLGYLPIIHLVRSLVVSCFCSVWLCLDHHTETLPPERKPVSYTPHGCHVHYFLIFQYLPSYLLASSLT